MKYLNHLHSIFNHIIEDSVILHPKPKGGLLMATEPFDRAAVAPFLRLLPQMAFNGIYDRLRIISLYSLIIIGGSPQA